MMKRRALLSRVGIILYRCFTALLLEICLVLTLGFVIGSTTNSRPGISRHRSETSRLTGNARPRDAH